MQNNKLLELKNVKIDRNIYPDVRVYGLERAFDVTDHDDDYGFGESAQVITGIYFDLVVIHLYDCVVEIDAENKSWQSVKKQVTEHIFDDHEFMQQWQDMEFKE